MYCLLATSHSPVTFDLLHIYLTVKEVILHEIRSNLPSLTNQAQRPSTGSTWKCHTHASGLSRMHVAVIHECFSK